MSLKKLGEGVYADAEGVLHLDLPELCIANGFEPTQENQDRLEAVTMDLLAGVAGQMGSLIEVEEIPDGGMGKWRS